MLFPPTDLEHHAHSGTLIQSAQLSSREHGFDSKDMWPFISICGSSANTMALNKQQKTEMNLLHHILKTKTLFNLGKNQLK